MNLESIRSPVRLTLPSAEEDFWGDTEDEGGALSIPSGPTSPQPHTPPVQNQEV